MSADFTAADIVDCPPDPPYHERRLHTGQRGGRLVICERDGMGWLASDAVADLGVWR